jgi:dolichyl-phosphate beta-glucosyltransferase
MTYQTPALVPSPRRHDDYSHCTPLPLTDFDLVIPALNEEHRIGQTIIDTCRQLEGETFSARLIVVDNGSVDATAEAVDAARRAHVPVEVIGCRRRGKGAAVRAGIRYAHSRHIAYFDADLSTPPSAIAEAYTLLESGWDAVVGSRRCAGAEYAVAQPWVRRVGSKVFSLAATGMASGITDTQCGFKAFRADVAKRVFDKMITDGFAFDVEVIARVQRAGYQVTELPVRWQDHDGSSFRPINDGLRAFRELVTARQALRAVGE